MNAKSSSRTSSRTSARTRRFILMAALGSILLLFVSGAFYYQNSLPKYRKIEISRPQIRSVTITGEVVDAWCYASQTMGPGRGEGHKACALACSYGGVTMGILEDGTKELYVAAKSKGYHGCNEMLIPYVAQKVTVTGWVGDLGGSRMLKIDKITPLQNQDQNQDLEHDHVHAPNH